MAKFSSLKSFEEVSKTAYSHGFENIYALENVDIKTVRPLKSAHENLKESDPDPLSASLPAEDPQEVFDFGINYRTSMDHFVVKEPIQVLGLSRYLENSLLAQGKRRLQDLLNLEVKGFGQGHIDEVNSKLKEYVGSRRIKKSRRIDFTSWLKSIVGDLDSKKVCVILESYNLNKLIPLTTAENMELRRLTLEKRMEWQEEAKRSLLCEEKKHQIDKDFWEVVEVFIKPWMDCRKGIATESELKERLYQISESQTLQGEILEFFQETYFKGVFPLNRYLEPLDDGVFASAPWIAYRYDQIIEKTLTYFYKANATYSFEFLVRCLEREFALQWLDLGSDFLIKVLKHSPRFRVFKTNAGLLSITLS